MDITETFRAEDISKTDFFDFVVAPEVGEAPHALTFNRTLMKSMGIFIENPAINSNPSQMSAFQELKETNNNHLVMTTAASSVSTGGDTGAIAFSDHGFWSPPPPCDKERLETSFFEDLNNYCWSHDSDASGSSSHKDGNGGGGSGGGVGNTDGAIYTLTVLHGSEQQPGAAAGSTWYRPPEAGAAAKGERVAVSSAPTTATDSGGLRQMTAQQQPSALDLESILSIIPSDSHPHPSGSPFHSNGYHSHAQHPTGGRQEASTLSPHNTIGHEIKSEQQHQYSYEHLSESSPMMDAEGEAFSANANHSAATNNNDWKMGDNNGGTNVESLLRSALQGKGTFINRYNGSHKSDCMKDGHAELRRALSTPPGSHGSGSKTPTAAGSPAFLSDTADDSADKKPLVQHLHLENGPAGRTVMFDEGEHHSPPTNSVDDILFSFPGGFDEKIRTITNEVVESAKRFCVMEQQPHDHHVAHQPIYMPRLPPQTHDGLSLIPLNHHHPHHQHHHQQHHHPQQQTHHHHTLTSPPAQQQTHTPSQQTPARTKKYSKKQSSAAKGATQPASGAPGARKERSLHYCSICSKGFKDKYSVNVHIRTHTGEKPFSCTLCGKSFRQKAHLAKHYQTHIAQKSLAPGSAAGGSGSSNNCAGGSGVGKPTANKNRFASPKT